MMLLWLQHNKIYSKMQIKIIMQSTEQERLSEWIAMQGWTKTEFAARMEIHPQNVSKYLSGALKIEGLYGKLMDNGCDIHWLRNGYKKMESAQMLDILQRMGITSPEQLQKFLDVEDIAKDVEAVLLSRLHFKRK